MNTDIVEGGMKYLIEDLRTGKWLCFPTEIYCHSYLQGELSGGWDTRWTNDANFAIKWNTREEAEAHNKKYFNMPDIEVTEHEFVNDQPKTNK